MRKKTSIIESFSYNEYFLKHKLLFLAFCLFFTIGYGQKNNDFPYEGGEATLLKEISNHLLVEPVDTGRIYFMEIYYDKKKKEIASAIHGIAEKEMISARLITDFFEDRKQNWNKKLLKRT